jgi:hypothetical protein
MALPTSAAMASSLVGGARAGAVLLQGCVDSDVISPSWRSLYALQIIVGQLRAENSSPTRPWRTSFLSGDGVAVVMRFFGAARGIGSASTGGGGGGGGGGSTPVAAADDAEDPTLPFLNNAIASMTLRVFQSCVKHVSRPGVVVVDSDKCLSRHALWCSACAAAGHRRRIDDWNQHEEPAGGADARAERVPPVQLAVAGVHRDSCARHLGGAVSPPGQQACRGAVAGSRYDAGSARPVAVLQRVAHGAVLHPEGACGSPAV